MRLFGNKFGHHTAGRYLHLIKDDPQKIDVFGWRLESMNYNRLQVTAKDKLKGIDLGMKYDPEKAKLLASFLYRNRSESPYKL